MLVDAYKSESLKTARKRLAQIVSWLDRNGEEDAAASLREGLEESLTVWKLDLPEALRRFFATTNAIENVMGTIRRVSRNVKRWRHGAMAKRWAALGLGAAQARFNRITGHRQLPVLFEALKRRAAATVDQDEALVVMNLSPLPVAVHSPSCWVVAESEQRLRSGFARSRFLLLVQGANAS